MAHFLHAAFDAGYCSGLGKPYITLHAEDIVHPLKEVDARALAWCSTAGQVVQTLRYVLEGHSEGITVVWRG